MSTFGRLVQDRHRRAARMLGFALTQAEREGWLRFGLVAELRLSVQERAALAFSALRALPDEVALAVVDEIRRLASPAGISPPLLQDDPMDEALWWSALASPEELRAYALATLFRLSPRERAEIGVIVGPGEAGP